nr:MAG TPA: hypothetical protein [Caudoviricetes sp.]
MFEHVNFPHLVVLTALIIYLEKVKCNILHKKDITKL